MFDIETTNLSADFGRMLVACVKEWKGPTVTIRQDQFSGYRNRLWDDKPLVERLLNEIGRYDMLVTYYGRFFDLPYLSSRAMLIRNRRPLAIFHADMHLPAKKYLKLGSRRLARVQEFMQLEESKTPIAQEQWLRAAAGDEEGLDYVAEHCVADVAVLEEVYDRLLPYLTQIKRVII